MKNEINAEKPPVISRYDYEAALMHQSVAHRRTIIILCAVIVFFAALSVVETVLRHVENKKWLAFLEQYDYVSNETVTVDGQTGVANYIGKDGTIYNGEDYGQANASANQEEPLVQGDAETQIP